LVRVPHACSRSIRGSAYGQQGRPVGSRMSVKRRAKARLLGSSGPPQHSRRRRYPSEAPDSPLLPPAADRGRRCSGAGRRSRRVLLDMVVTSSFSPSAPGRSPRKSSVRLHAVFRSVPQRPLQRACSQRRSQRACGGRARGAEVVITVRDLVPRRSSPQVGFSPSVPRGGFDLGDLLWIGLARSAAWLSRPEPWTSARGTVEEQTRREPGRRAPQAVKGSPRRAEKNAEVMFRFGLPRQSEPRTYL